MIIVNIKDFRNAMEAMKKIAGRKMMNGDGKAMIKLSTCKDDGCLTLSCSEGTVYISKVIDARIDSEQELEFVFDYFEVKKSIGNYIIIKPADMKVRFTTESWEIKVDWITRPTFNNKSMADLAAKTLLSDTNKSVILDVDKLIRALHGIEKDKQGRQLVRIVINGELDVVVMSGQEVQDDCIRVITPIIEKQCTSI